MKAQKGLSFWMPAAVICVTACVWAWLMQACGPIREALTSKPAAHVLAWTASAAATAEVTTLIEGFAFCVCFSCLRCAWLTFDLASAAAAAACWLMRRMRNANDL